MRFYTDQEQLAFRQIARSSKNTKVVILDDAFQACFGGVMIEEIAHHRTVERFWTAMTGKGRLGPKRGKLFFSDLQISTCDECED